MPMPSPPAVDELAVARRQFDLRLYDQAIATLRRSAYSDNGRSAVEALFLIASIHEERSDVADAMSTYVEIATRFPADTRAPEALLKLAQATLKASLGASGAVAAGRDRDERGRIPAR
jgi:TolA-binding protein